MEGVGMKGTTTDLFTGTSKVTRQLPGYGGYIPQAHRQVSAAEDLRERGVRVVPDETSRSEQHAQERDATASVDEAVDNE